MWSRSVLLAVFHFELILERFRDGDTSIPDGNENNQRFLTECIMKLLHFKYSLDIQKSRFIEWKWISAFLSQNKIICENVGLNFSEPVINGGDMEKVIFDFAGIGEYFGL